MSLTHLTDEMFREAIDAQELEFDSHSIIRHFYKRHQPAYVLELATRVGAAAYPVTETNRMIGLELLKYDQLIRKIDEHRSVTIGGDEHPCAVWRKR
jgi:hypothetical protein